MNWSMSTRPSAQHAQKFQLRCRNRVASSRNFSRYRIPRAPSFLKPGAATLFAGAAIVTGFGRPTTDNDTWRAFGSVSGETRGDTSRWPDSATVIVHRGQRRHLHEYARDYEDRKRHEGNSNGVAQDGGEGTGKGSENKGQHALLKAASAVRKTVSTLSDNLSDRIMPDWIKMVPGFVEKLQNELSMAPGSLAEEIWNEAHDVEVNPEIMWDASVRVGEDLCHDEKLFRRRRLVYTRKALSKYLDIPEEDIHYDDIPTIAMCNSGGGLRALVAGSSSYLSAKEAGLFDCITYSAGVSGSCWLQGLFYSSLTGQNFDNLINHLKNRIGVHIAFPPKALGLLASAPTNKYLLSGLVEKLRGVPDADFGIVDAYGLLLAARLLVPKGDLNIDDRDLKLSNQRDYVDYGDNPLPIYAAVRHEIPFAKDKDRSEGAKQKARKEAWFQWFEFTPYEFWCEELHAGIPMWAVGRKFDKGQTVWRDNDLTLPQVRLPILFGIWGSAFCATLSHYYKEIQPLLYETLKQQIQGREDDMVKYHPIDPANIPNFALGMKEQLPQSVPASFYESERLELMDAGMSNNLPIYPLLRPERKVDIIIAFDASADPKTDNWLKVADGYARQRGIKGWPIGAGWPPEDKQPKELAKDIAAAEASSESEAQQKLAQAKEDQAKNEESMHRKSKSNDLGFCNVWVGSAEERETSDEPPPSKRIDEDFELLEKNAGLTVIYNPFLANPKVDGVDPHTSDFMSTWNFVYTPDEIEKVVELARANFDAGAETMKRTVRAVYERKKLKRLQEEDVVSKEKRRRNVRRGLDGRDEGHGDAGDHFS